MSPSDIALSGNVLLAGIGRGLHSNVVRFALVAVGGYWVVAAVASAAAAVLSLLLDRSEAVVLMAMLAFLVYLALLIWGFAEPRLVRLWWVLGGGGSSAFAAQWLVGMAG